MTRIIRQPHIDIDTPQAQARRARRRQCDQLHGFVWNSTTQEFIEYLPENHPDYRQNQEIIRAAIRRWNGETK